MSHARVTTFSRLVFGRRPGVVVRYRPVGRQQPTIGEVSGVMMAEDVRAEIVASVLEVVVKKGDQIGEGDTLVLL